MGLWGAYNNEEDYWNARDNASVQGDYGSTAQPRGLPLDQARQNSVAPTPTQPQGLPGENWATKIGDLMQTVGAGFQGKPDPVAARKLQQQKQQLQERQFQFQQQKEASDTIEKFLNIADKAGLDDTIKSKLFGAMVDSNPTLKTVFGPHMDNLTFAGKEVERKGYAASEGEFTDPISNKPLPAGTYDLKGKPQGGTWKFSHIAPSQANDSTKTDNDLAVAYFGKKFADLKPDEQRSFARIKGLPQNVAAEISAKGYDFTDPAMRERLPKIIDDALAAASKRTEQRGINVVVAGKQAEQDIKPLEQGDRQAISAIDNTVRVAKKLKSEFTPEELNQYVGWLKNPAQKALQAVRDPNSPEAKKFAKFQTYVNEAKGSAFSEGGKQLTPFEASITFGHIVTGNEFNTADFITKLDNTIQGSEYIKNNRIHLATTPRRELQRQGGGVGQPLGAPSSANDDPLGIRH